MRLHRAGAFCSQQRRAALRRMRRCLRWSRVRGRRLRSAVWPLPGWDSLRVRAMCDLRQRLPGQDLRGRWLRRLVRGVRCRLELRGWPVHHINPTSADIRALLLHVDVLVPAHATAPRKRLVRMPGFLWLLAQWVCLPHVIFRSIRVTQARLTEPTRVVKLLSLAGENRRSKPPGTWRGAMSSSCHES